MNKDWLLIAFVLAFGFCIGYFSMPEKTKTNTETVIKCDTTFVHDTIKVENRIPSKPITITDTFWRSLPIDTDAILQAYHNKNYYSDTLVNDSTLLVVVNDTISKNQLQSRIPFIVKHYPIITNTITSTETQTATADKWFVGGYAGKSMGAEISYLKNKNMWGVGAGTNGIYLKYSRQIK